MSALVRRLELAGTCIYILFGPAEQGGTRCYIEERPSCLWMRPAAATSANLSQLAQQGLAGRVRDSRDWVRRQSGEAVRRDCGVAGHLRPDRRIWVSGEPVEHVAGGIS